MDGIVQRVVQRLGLGILFRIIRLAVFGRNHNGRFIILVNGTLFDFKTRDCHCLFGFLCVFYFDFSVLL